MKTIKGKIRNGKINMNFEGFVGKNCDIEEEKLLSDLKVNIEERENKPEYYEEEKEFNTETEGGW